jgi:colicin import membrane protein
MVRAQPDPHPVGAGIAVVAMHGLLVGGLVLGVDWQRDALRPTTVKLWSAPLGNPEPISKPEPAPRKPASPPSPKQEPPKRDLVEPQPTPPPMVQAPPPPAFQPPAPAVSRVEPTVSPQPARQPVPPPEPQAPRPPDIAFAERAPVRAPVAAPRAPEAPALQAPAPPAPPRPEPDAERKRDEAIALAAQLNAAEADRQRLLLEEQQRREEIEQRRRQREKVARRLRELNDSMEHDRTQQRASEAHASATRALIDDYIARISAKVRQRVILPTDLEGNPEAIFQVDLLASGEVVTTKLLKSSGSTPYDAAVQRAILAAQPLPVPEDPRLFHATFQNFLLSFRPKE